MTDQLVGLVNCLTPNCLRRGTGGDRDPGGGGRGRLYLPLHCHHQSNSALRSAITRAVLKFSLIEGELHKTECTDHTFRRERTAESESNRSSSPYQSNALPLSQTGSWPGDRQTRFFTNEIQTHKRLKTKQKKTRYLLRQDKASKFSG